MFASMQHQVQGPYAARWDLTKRGLGFSKAYDDASATSVVLLCCINPSRLPFLYPVHTFRSTLPTNTCCQLGHIRPSTSIVSHPLDSPHLQSTVADSFSSLRLTPNLDSTSNSAAHQSSPPS